MDIQEKFATLSKKVATWAGSPIAFIFAMLSVLIWLAVGPYFHWSDSHSLFINTFSTCITYVLIFIIQNTQNRESKAMQLKLDELVRGNQKSRNSFINIETMTDKELQQLEREMRKLRHTDVECVCKEKE